MPGSATNAITRRRLLALFGLGAAVPVLYACGGTAVAPTAAPAKPAAGATTVAAPTSAPAAAAKPAAGNAVALKVIYWSSSPQDNKVFVDTFNAFSEKNPGITVEFDDVPSDGFVQKATTMIVGGTPPDAMELHPAWVLNFITAKQLNDLTDMAKDDKPLYIPAQLDFWLNDGKQYGVPYYSGPSFIFYNKTLFAKAGAKTPEEHQKAGTWTWETLRDLAKQTTTGSGSDKTFGWDASTDASALQFYTCVPIWCNKGEVITQDNTAWTVDSAPVVEVMQWHADMYLKEKSIPMPSDMQGISWIFNTGRVAMAWAGRFRSVELVNAPFEVGMVNTPKGKAGPVNRDGPNATGLPTGTKNVAEAYKFARFIGSPDGAATYLSSGRTLPVQTALLDSEAFKKSLKPFERLEVFQEAGKTVRAWRLPGKGAEALRAFKAEWDKVLAGQADVPTAMKAAKAAMDPLLKVK